MYKFMILTLVIIFSIFHNLNTVPSNSIYSESETEYDLMETPKLSTSNTFWTPNGTAICTAIDGQDTPLVISDGAGGAIMAWQDYRNQFNYDIYAQRIDTDGKIKWITDGMGIVNRSGSQEFGGIISDGAGGAIIAWQDSRGASDDIYAQKIDSNGISLWDANGTVICNYLGNQREAKIASDGAGGAIITWRDYRSGSDIYAQRINSSGDIQWTPNGTAICTATGTQSNPLIINDGVGGGIITWRDYRSATNWDIYAQRINSSGDIQWTPNGTGVFTNSISQGTPEICSDGAGGAIISGFTGSWLYAQRINSSGSKLWAVNGTEISTAVSTKQDQKIIEDGAGGAILVWEDVRGGVYSNIYAQRINSSGSVLWTANGIAVCPGSWQQWAPHLATDGQRGASIVWSDTRDGSGDIYIQLINQNGIPLITNGSVICSMTDAQYFPQVLNDGTGSFIVIWEDDRYNYLGFPYGNDIFAQRFRSTIVISAEINNQRIPKMISDGADGVIVAWTDYRSGTDNDVYAQRITSSGSVQWTANGIPICTEINGQSVFGLVSDGAGGAIIVWRDYRSGTDYDLYAQRINSTGDIQWTPNGTAICTASDLQTEVDILSDGTGGAIIAWSDKREGGIFPYNIYIQRINNTGSIQWTPNGTAICTEVYDQFDPKLTTDGGGGAIITWWDERDVLMADIYAQHVDSNGIIQWDANGTVICNETDVQYNAAITSDGAGGAIITWVDERAPWADIYAQRIGSNGNRMWNPSGVEICMALRSQVDVQIVTDGEGGAILAWEDYRMMNAAMDPGIYAQRIDSNGSVLWDNDGNFITYEFDRQYDPVMVSDELGGAVIVWKDERNGVDIDIYAQRINSSGSVLWVANGTAISKGEYNQNYPQIVSNWDNGFFITWEDYISGSDYDINLLIIPVTDELPKSNSPNDITTNAGGSETIGWIINDDYGDGEYRIIANDTNGNLYVLYDWTPYTKGIYLNVEINRSNPGVYNYTIIYRDENNHFGIPDIVIVTITDATPTSSDPGPISTTSDGEETIYWILYDDFGGGQYRVIIDDTEGNSYVWVNWKPWTGGVDLKIPINRNTTGIFYYTIEYYDIYNNMGINQTIQVTVNETPPESRGGIWYFPYIQAIITGAISAGVGIVIKKTYSSRKKRKEIYEKIRKELTKIPDLKQYMKSNLAPGDWEQLRPTWYNYQGRQITEAEFIKQGMKTLGDNFTDLFIKDSLKKE